MEQMEQNGASGEGLEERWMDGWGSKQPLGKDPVNKRRPEQPEAPISGIMPDGSYTEDIYIYIYI